MSLRDYAQAVVLGRLTPAQAAIGVLEESHWDPYQVLPLAGGVSGGIAGYALGRTMGDRSMGRDLLAAERKLQQTIPLEQKNTLRKIARRRAGTLPAVALASAGAAGAPLSYLAFDQLVPHNHAFPRLF